MTVLRHLIDQSGLKHTSLRQARLAEACGISQPALSLLIRHGLLPKRDTQAILDRLGAALIKGGLPPAEVEAALSVIATGQPAAFHRIQAPLETTVIPNDTQEEIVMILKRQSLKRETRQAFALTRDPFDEPQQPEQVYLSAHSRYVREALRDAAVNGNFLAVVGESGSGKSTLKCELCQYLEESEKNTIVIEPYVLNMSFNDNGAGKPLRATNIMDAILHRLQPDTNPGRSSEVKGQRLHSALINSSKAGNKHVLIIEEAHDLHSQTLKSLKRFWELKSGMKRLLSIILIGQTELSGRLASTNAEVREVVQRIDVVKLPPLPDVGEFIRHRFSSSGLDAMQIFTDEAIDELRQRLIVGRDKSGKGIDMAYPLTVSNLAVACLNFAAQNGLRHVDADVVRTAQVQ